MNKAEIMALFDEVEERFDRVASRHKAMGHEMKAQRDRIAALEKLVEELKAPR